MRGLGTGMHVLRRPALWLSITALIMPGTTVLAQAPSHPATLSAAASSPMSLVAEAARQHLFGQQDLYTIGLYAAPPLDQERVASPEVAKALRIAITYETDWQRPAVVDWRTELVPRWQTEWVAQLRAAFSALRRGDVVLIEYSPRTGTKVHVNRSIAVLAAPHELMLAFLDHWLGQRPVSEDVKRSLLARH